MTGELNIELLRSNHLSLCDNSRLCATFCVLCQSSLKMPIVIVNCMKTCVDKYNKMNILSYKISSCENTRYDNCVPDKIAAGNVKLFVKAEVGLILANFLPS